jgi:prevent-host-death family protein
MIRATDIHSLTEFTRNARSYIQQVKANKSPIAITVNGDAQVVVCDAEQYQKMVDEIERARITHTLNAGINGSGIAVSELNQPFSMVRSAVPPE